MWDLDQDRTHNSVNEITSIDSDSAPVTMMSKLAQSASKRWRLLNGSQILPEVLQGVLFKDGIQVTQAAA